MNVIRGETSVVFGGQTSLVSLSFHRQEVNRETIIYIYKTTTSLLLSLFHSHALATHLYACARMRGGGEE